jgi:YD repeat-containing protein
VNNLNDLTNVTRSGTLTVAGTTTSTATNVAVNSTNATLYNDKTFAKDGFTVTNGNNAYTAIAQDSYNREDTNSVVFNLPSTVNYIYDLNGNLTSDSTRGFEYDDENELMHVTVTNTWKSEFTYDGKMRRRIRKEFTWQNSTWIVSRKRKRVSPGIMTLKGSELPATAKRSDKSGLKSFRSLTWYARILQYRWCPLLRCRGFPKSTGRSSPLPDIDGR